MNILGRNFGTFDANSETVYVDAHGIQGLCEARETCTSFHHFCKLMEEMETV